METNKRNTAKEKRKNNKGYPYRNKGSKQIRIKMEQQKIKNKWKERTIALVMISLMLIVILFFQIKEEIPTDLELCQATTGVPAYVSTINKEVIFTGNHGVPEPGVIDSLIEEQIAFVYSTGCPHCANQIEAFGDDWIKYQESGLTVDCSKLK